VGAAGGRFRGSSERPISQRLVHAVEWIACIDEFSDTPVWRAPQQVGKYALQTFDSRLTTIFLMARTIGPQGFGAIYGS
jgi:hypothetical protein